MTTFLRRNWISAIVIVALIVGWEVAGHLAPKSPLRESPIVPPWEFVFGRAIVGLSDYWKFPFWAPVPELGGEQTLLGAGLAVAYHSLLTLYRLALGLLVGAVAGVALGLAVSRSHLARALLGPSLHLVRTCPLLAMTPLFQFWLGGTNLAAILFVAYGVGVIYLIGTINAVANVPVKFIESALTMGATKSMVYRAVVLPAILPELFSSIFLTLGLAWSAVIGAEYIGVDGGIGRMIIWSEYFSNTGRIAAITILIIVYAFASYAVWRRVQRRMLRWHPQADRSLAAI